MDIVKIKDKTFRTFIPESEIQSKVKAVADKLNKDMAGKNPLFLAVLNGSFIFAADLMRYLSIPCEISFVKLASYQGTTSVGKVKELIGINQELKGRTVVIVEDIVDTGNTMKQMLATLEGFEPESLRRCRLTSSIPPWKSPTTSSWAMDWTMTSRAATSVTSTPSWNKYAFC